MTSPAAAIPYFRDAVERALAAAGGVELTAPAQVSGIDGRRVWVFPRTVWESEVVRAVGFTSRKETE